jgi:hypothetical protein
LPPNLKAAGLAGFSIFGTRRSTARTSTIGTRGIFFGDAFPTVTFRVLISSDQLENAITNCKFAALWIEKNVVGISVPFTLAAPPSSQELG